jgi:hypothetical protein
MTLAPNTHVKSIELAVIRTYKAWRGRKVYAKGCPICPEAAAQNEGMDAGGTRQ